MTHRTKENKKSKADKVADFISANKKIIIGAIALVVIVIVALAILEKRINDIKISNSELTIQV